jgi:hypothetical protein
VKKIRLNPTEPVPSRQKRLVIARAFFLIFGNLSNSEMIQGAGAVESRYFTPLQNLKLVFSLAEKFVKNHARINKKKLWNCYNKYTQYFENIIDCQSHF